MLKCHCDPKLNTVTADFTAALAQFSYIERFIKILVVIHEKQ